MNRLVKQLKQVLHHKLQRHVLILRKINMFVLKSKEHTNLYYLGREVPEIVRRIVRAVRGICRTV